MRVSRFPVRVGFFARQTKNIHRHHQQTDTDTRAPAHTRRPQVPHRKSSIRQIKAELLKTNPCFHVAFFSLGLVHARALHSKLVRNSHVSV